jgi:hypothetical protein
VCGHVLGAAGLGQLGSALVDEVHLLLGLQLVVSLADAGTVEGVGLNDVSASLQVLQVDALNDIWPGDDQDVVVALELVAVVLVPAVDGRRKLSLST